MQSHPPRSHADLVSRYPRAAVPSAAVTAPRRGRRTVLGLFAFAACVGVGYGVVPSTEPVPATVATTSSAAPSVSAAPEAAAPEADASAHRSASRGPDAASGRTPSAPPPGNLIPGTTCVTSHECGANAECQGGQCACQDYARRCGNLCVEKADPNHCGACGKACKDDEICYDNGKGILCDPCTSPGVGGHYCGVPHQCRNLETSFENCGACGHSCAQNQWCGGGACVDQLHVGDKCSDSYSCAAVRGECNLGRCACISSRGVVNGVCASCPKGMHASDSKCVPN